MLSFRDILTNNRIFGVAFLASGLLVPVVASAAPAVVSSTINVRTGPGGGYARVATLPAGMAVDAGPCRGGWCQVRRGGSYGWVSARYVRFGTRAYAAYPPPGYASAYAGPAYVDNSGFGLGLATGLVTGGGWGPGWRVGGWRGGPDYYRGYRGGYRGGWNRGGHYGGPGWNRGGGWNPHWGVGPAHFGGNRGGGYHIGGGARPFHFGR